MAGTEILGLTEAAKAEGDSVYLTLHCHHHNGFCIKMGSNESRFNVSLVVRDKVTRQCPHDITLHKKTNFEERRGEPKRN